MKKTILYLIPFVLLALFANGLYAGGQIEWFTETIQEPVYFPQTSNCMTIYAVGGGTISAASFYVTADSITFVSAGGLYPGTTSCSFFESNKDTVGELISFLNAMPATTLGIGGGIVATISQGCYDGNVSASMTVVASQDIHTSTNVKTCTIDSIIGMTYTIPASTNGDSIYLTNVVVSSSSQSGRFNVYDGTSTAQTQLRRESVTSDTSDTLIYIPKDDFKGTANTAMRIDYIQNSPMTDQYINFTYKKRR